MLARRLLIALAVLMVITALAAGLAPRESAMNDDSPAPSATAAVVQKPVMQTLDAQTEGQRVEAEVGQIVRIVVTSDELDTVSMAELGFETTEPDSPARFELLAEVPGTYPIKLLEADRQIGELEISGAD
jgi:hypothetical protein